MENINEIKKAAEAEAEKLGLKIHDAYFTSDKDGKTLHLEVDKKGGVTLKDVNDFTDLINPVLDQMEGLDSPYTLDCSSPGAERFISIDELNDHLGEYMEISLKDKKILGNLIDQDETTITMKHFIKGRPKNDTVLKADIQKVQLRIKF
ncbi:MAG: hypothetical protein LKJ88_06550 [Bacilli bacterium]|nr:hypothetical protein [Bacilli bacterium]